MILRRPSSDFEHLMMTSRKNSPTSIVPSDEINRSPPHQIPKAIFSAPISSVPGPTFNKKGADIEGDSPLVSRITWAILLGVLAGVLLKAGGLGALQTAVVIFGIPFSIITAFACRELYRSLDDEFNS